MKKHYIALAVVGIVAIIGSHMFAGETAKKSNFFKKLGGK